MDQQRFVVPKVFLLGATQLDEMGLIDYLRYTDQAAFLEAFEQAKAQGLSGAEILCSFYAKLCYKTLVPDRNANVNGVRDIWDNLIATFDSAHGSVFEHVQFNFVITDCSRVMTHEQVRHRIGVAYSQTSGRYTRLDFIPLVWDPILDDCRDLAEFVIRTVEDVVYAIECRKGLRIPPPAHPNLGYGAYLAAKAGDNPDPLAETLKWIPNKKLPFDHKKKLTSAIRRLVPNGQSNELGYSVNLRALRHIVQMRTARAAEWEIRQVYAQIYTILAAKYPLIFYGAKVEEVDDAIEVRGMKMNPYERIPTWQEMLVGVDETEVESFLAARAVKTKKPE